MDRSECEELLVRKVLEIRRIYKEYNPDGDYLTMHVSNTAISINNSHWIGGKDAGRPINVFELMEDLR